MIPKKTKSISELKWEFLRRNPEYIDEYNKKGALTYISAAPTSEAELNKIFEDGQKTEWDSDNDEKLPFPLNWGLFKPADPTKDLPENILKNASPYSKNMFFPCPFTFVTVESMDNVVQGQFYLHLNFTKKEIMKSFEEQVDFFLQRYAPFKTGKENRARLIEYERYIQVYDLRENGWDWDKLAKKFYKSDSDRNYAKKKVKLDYERCLKMIKGGFRQIG